MGTIVSPPPGLAGLPVPSASSCCTLLSPAGPRISGQGPSGSPAHAPPFTARGAPCALTCRGDWRLGTAERPLGWGVSGEGGREALDVAPQTPHPGPARGGRGTYDLR